MKAPWPKSESFALSEGYVLGRSLETCRVVEGVARKEQLLVLFEIGQLLSRFYGVFVGVQACRPPCFEPRLSFGGFWVEAIPCSTASTVFQATEGGLAQRADWPNRIVYVLVSGR